MAKYRFIKSLILFFWIGTSVNLFGQSVRLDSLRQQFEANREYDSLRVWSLIRLTNYFVENQKDSAILYAEKALQAAQTINNQYLEGLTNLNFGATHLKLFQPESALPYYQSAYQVFEERKDTSLMYSCQVGLMQTWGDMKNIETALEHFEQAKKLATIANGYGKYALISYMGALYGRQDDSETAKKYFIESFWLSKKIKDFSAEGIASMNLGIVNGILEQFDSCIFYYKNALEIFENSESLSQIALVTGNLGGHYLEIDSFSQAVFYFKKAISTYQKMGNADAEISIFSNLMKAHLKLENYSEAVIAGQKAWELTKTQPATFLQQKEILYDLISTFEKSKTKEKALPYLNKLVQIQDSLLIEKGQQELAELEAKYKTEAQKNSLTLKNAQLKQQKVLIWATIFLILLLTGLAYLIWKTAQERKKANAILKKQTKELQSLDRAKSRFFTNISHELRTPLQLILSPLENSIKYNKTKVIQKDLQLAHQNSKKLLTLVNEILDLSKLEGGKLQLNEKPLQLKPFLRRILFSYHSLASLREFMLSFEYELADNLWISVDRKHLEKIINNLLSNAFKYSNPGGVITLVAKKGGGQLLNIEVQDQGKGIAPEELEKIFDRFYQAEGENEPLQGGTGVGLALAKELARLSDGDLRVESELDRGSKFKLILPLKKINPDGTVTISEKNQLKPASKIGEKPMPAYQPILLNGKKPKILIVEDNPEMSQFLHRILSPIYHCTLAQNGQRGLELAQSEVFDLITSDVMMPNLDGFSFFKKLKSGEIHRSTPFILLTARALESDKIQGLRLGVDDYITKPFSTNELLARIANLLENKKQRDEWLTNQQPTMEKEVESLSFEEQQIKVAEQKVIENISNSKYSVELLCRDLNYSRRKTERLIKKLTGLSPLAFIKEIRLQQAQYYLQNQNFATISEVAYEVGFEDPGYFSKVYLKRFGKRPSEIM